VLFQQDNNAAYDYKSTGSPQVDVIPKAFNNYLKQIEQAILDKSVIVDTWNPIVVRV